MRLIMKTMVTVVFLNTTQRQTDWKTTCSSDAADSFGIVVTYQNNKHFHFFYFGFPQKTPVIPWK